ncbi:MAG: hypothetical protein ABUT11_01765 [Leifsonia sp.]
MPRHPALALAPLAIALSAALAGCASPGQPAAQTTHTATATPTPTPTPTPVATPLSLSVREPHLRDTISVSGIVRDFPVEGVSPNDEIVLVQVSVTTGGSYWAGWDTTRLLLTDSAGHEYPPKTLDNILAAMTKWGFTPFAAANNGSSSIPASHTSAPGWVAFDVYSLTPPLYFADRVVPVEGGTPSTYTVALPAKP